MKNVLNLFSKRRPGHCPTKLNNQFPMAFQRKSSYFFGRSRSSPVERFWWGSETKDQDRKKLLLYAAESEDIDLLRSITDDGRASGSIVMPALMEMIKKRNKAMVSQVLLCSKLEHFQIKAAINEAKRLEKPDDPCLMMVMLLNYQFHHLNKFSTGELCTPV